MSRSPDLLSGADLAADERRLRILQLLRSDGRIDVATVADQLEVARETVRRDLTLLEQQGRLQRVHGGAVATQTMSTPTTQPQEDDLELGRRLWQRLPRAGTMIIGAGRPGCLLADAILEDPPEQDLLTVVTGSLDAAIALSRIPQLLVYNLGGTVRARSHAQEGMWTIEELRRLRCDVCVISPDGVDARGGLTARDPARAAVAEAECESAGRVIAVADDAALGTTALVRFAPITRLTELIMVERADADRLAAVRELGVQVTDLQQPRRREDQPVSSGPDANRRGRAESRPGS